MVVYSKLYNDTVKKSGMKEQPIVGDMKTAAVIKGSEAAKEEKKPDIPSSLNILRSLCFLGNY